MHFSTISRLHDIEAMAAVQSARLPPMHVQELHQSVIKRPFEPLTKTSAESFSECLYNKTDETDEDFSDHDSHYSEDFLDDRFEIPLEQGPDVTQRLLNFADMVNLDIQKFFGKKKDEDSCDIYEDKWVTTKSGRELYYADLLRIAQGENVDTKNRKEILTSNNSPPEKGDNTHKFSGKLDTKVGLGPLEELFRYGLKDFISDKKRQSKKLKRLQSDVKKVSELTPMNQRKFPLSFWREPGRHKQNELRVNGNGAPIINSNQPPDFSDLLQNWTRGEEEEYSGDMSSSEISVESTGSPTMEQL